MKKKEIVEFWVTEAEESKEIASHLFDKKDFSYALFFGHLAIEKLIKAIYAKNIDENVPRSHNLPRLAKEAVLTFRRICFKSLFESQPLILRQDTLIIRKDFEKSARNTLPKKNSKTLTRCSNG